MKCKYCEQFFSKFSCGISLFGECDCPKCQGMCECNETDGFEQFWKAWPKHPRKASKSLCLAKWKKTYCESCADQIIKHVEWLKTTDQWRKDNGAFIPAPLVYLNQQRWDGAEIPEVRTGKSEAKDPALVKIEQDEKLARPMPESVRERLRHLKSI